MVAITDQRIEEYAISKSEAPGQLLAELCEYTQRHTANAGMLSGPLVGRFLKMMVQISGARRVLEIGMFTGYSALSMAEGLPADGELITCDINPETIAIAKRYFAASEHGKKIRVIEGPALQSIQGLTAPLDLVFIDADKGNYLKYYEAVMPLLHSGGIILVDNVLWSGRVLKPADDQDLAIAALNDRVSQDERVDGVLLPVRDGLFLIRKK